MPIQLLPLLAGLSVVSIYWMLLSILAAFWYAVLQTSRVHMINVWSLRALLQPESRQARRALLRGCVFLIGLIAIIFGAGRLVGWLLWLS